jgi:hypothetical protein
MSRGEPPHAGAFRAAPDGDWPYADDSAEDDDVEFVDEVAGYGSLLGLGKPSEKKKKAVIELAPELAEKAAQVMELNAAQLMNHPDKSSQSFAFLGLDPLDPEDILDDEDLFDEDEEEEEEVAAPRFKKKLALGDPSEPAEAIDDFAAQSNWAEPEADGDLSPIEFPWRAADDAVPEAGETGAEPGWDGEEAEEEAGPVFVEDAQAEEPVHAEADFDPPEEPANPVEPEPAEEFVEPEPAAASLETEPLDEPVASFASEPLEEAAEPFETESPAAEEEEAEYFEEEAYASLEVELPASPGEPAFVGEDYSAPAEPDLPAAAEEPSFAGEDAYASLDAESPTMAGDAPFDGEEFAVPLDAEPPIMADSPPLDGDEFPAPLDFEEPAMADDAPLEGEEFPAPLEFEEPAMVDGAPLADSEQPAGIDIFAEPAMPIGIDHIVPPAPAEPEHRGHSLRARVVQNHQPEVTLGTLVMNFLRWLFAKLKQLWSRCAARPQSPYRK